MFVHLHSQNFQWISLTNALNRAAYKARELVKTIQDEKEKNLTRCHFTCPTVFHRNLENRSEGSVCFEREFFESFDFRDAMSELRLEITLWTTRFWTHRHSVNECLRISMTPKTSQVRMFWLKSFTPHWTPSTARHSIWKPPPKGSQKVN